MAQDSHAANPKGRKTGRNFASLRATFSRSATPVTEMQQNLAPKSTPDVVKSLQHRQSTPDVAKPQQAQQPPTATLEKRQSKMSLFDLFSKPKVERARGYHEQALDPLPERAQTPAHFYRRPEKATQPITQSRPASKMKGPIEKSPPKATPSKPNRPLDDWDPPPLFQAYPQAVKHGTLQGTNLSTVTLLRAQHYRKNGTMLHSFGSTATLPFVREGADGDQSSVQENSWHTSRRFSTLSETPELVDKVFVLVTAGRLAQYAGEGNYDRMPEKVLQLGEKSAAFACDLIPGKHWVVQVVQSANDDGVATINKSRSLLSRLRMPSSAGRRTTTSFLLVFSSAEDMDGWLRAIRETIRRLSGKSNESGEARHSRQNTAEKVPESILRAYSVQRAPSVVHSTRDRSSSSYTGSLIEQNPVQQWPSISTISKASPVDSPQMPFVDEAEEDQNVDDDDSFVPSADAPSLTTTVASTSSDQLRLERLREGSRHSVVSVRTSRTSDADTVTIATSRGSSSPPTPRSERSVEPEPARDNANTRSSFVRPSPAAFRGWRSSSQPAPVTRAAPAVIQTQRITAVHKYAALNPTNQLWMAKSTPLSSTILELPHSHTRMRTLKALSSDVHAPLDDRTDRKPSRRDSTVGQLPNISNRSSSRTDQPRARPFFRPLPIRPSEPNTAAAPNRSSQPVLLPTRTSPPKAAGTPTHISPAFPPPIRSSVSSAAALSNHTQLVPLTVAPAELGTAAIPNPTLHSFPLPIRSTEPSSIAARPDRTSQSFAARRFSSLPTTAISTPSASSFSKEPMTKPITRFSLVPAPSAVTPAAHAAAQSVANTLVQPQVPAWSSSHSSANSRTRPRAPSYSLTPAIHPPPQPATPQQTLLRRPTSLQIRSDPAPFLSARRSNASYRSSTTPVSTVPAMNPYRQPVSLQTSMPTTVLPGLPPPAPPPNMPLPAPPPNVPLPAPPSGQLVT